MILRDLFENMNNSGGKMSIWGDKDMEVHYINLYFYVC